MIRVEVDTAFNCRPKKGESRAKDGTGRLVKTSIITAGTIEEALADLAEVKKRSAEIAPGYAEIIGVRAYDREAFSAWVRNGGADPVPSRVLTADEIAAL